MVSDCNDANNRQNCEVCVLDKWILSLNNLKQANGYIKPDRLYIVANFTDIQGMYSRSKIRVSIYTSIHGLIFYN